MKLLALAVLLAVGVPALAQDIDPARSDPARLDRRVGKLESEMKAVQRKVFPGGDPKYFEPEVVAPPAAPPETVGNPASTPLSDLTQRVGALEAQLQTLTGQAEANQFKLRQLEEAQAKLRGDVEFRLNALEGGAKPADAAAATAATPPPGPGKPVDAAARPGKTRPVAAPVPDEPKPARPATAASAWAAADADVQAKKWPEAEAALGDFLAAYPKSPRAAQAQYLLGKARAEQGQRALAAQAYLELYQKYPKSPRAGDGLIGLANALIGLKKSGEACRVLGELDSVYGTTLTGGQKTEAAAARAKARCPA